MRNLCIQRWTSVLSERISPGMLVDYVLSARGMRREDLGVAPAVVMSWQPRVAESLARDIGAGDPVPLMRFTLYNGEVDGRRISVSSMPLGAPATVKCMEEMIACGARTFVGLGNAGGLQPSVPIGALILPTSCVGEEGTTVHYLQNGTVVGPDPQLAEAVLEACRDERVPVTTGPLWTTDAIYRETLDKIEAYRCRGVLGVDMETSAAYALGRFRNVAVCSLLAVSDEVWRDWNPAFGKSEHRKAVGRAARAILRCLSGAHFSTSEAKVEEQP